MYLRVAPRIGERRSSVRGRPTSRRWAGRARMHPTGCRDAADNSPSRRPGTPIGSRAQSRWFSYSTGRKWRRGGVDTVDEAVERNAVAQRGEAAGGGERSGLRHAFGVLELLL